MSKKIGKLKLNDNFKKKLESSIGMKINSSNSSSVPNKPKKTNKFTINNDKTPFIPPLPPIFKKLEPTITPKISNNEKQQDIIKKEYIPNDKGIVINNNITYPLPIINNNEIPVSNNNLITIAKLFFENNSYKQKKINKKNNKKNNDNFFNKKISMRDLIFFIFTFTTGYWFGRLSK